KINLFISDAPSVSHSESESHVFDVADFVGSTAKMIIYIETSDAEKFIVGTEVGLLHELKKRAPQKELIPLPIKEDNTCACSECAFMKMNTLEKVYRCLRDEAPEIQVDSSIFNQAKEPIMKMIEFSK